MTPPNPANPLLAPTSTAESTSTIAAVAQLRRRRSARWTGFVLIFSGLVLLTFLLSLMVGQTFYSFDKVLRVIGGDQVPGATFTVGRLRLPRAVLALLVGLSFGLGGVTFQTMLRNPLASPDIIGISSGASAAAVFAIVTLGLGSTGVSVMAIVAGLAVALVIYMLSYRNGAAGIRLILMGIGVSSMLNALINWELTRAAQWDLQEALRWLAGSLNGASWDKVVPLLCALIVLVPILLGQSRNLSITQLGDETAEALGVRVSRTRLLVIVAAVGLISFATAAAGPVAFVAFLSGPIASRLIGPGPSPLIPAALVGALLVLVADLVGQFGLGTRYPVGVVTGILGAPYLIYLIIRINRSGGSL
ncbi:iron chelate uptake ABC transporter family permease subunit [Brevibacterium sp.]|uniref:FecCD family ABC transporter permease n=1 Tax=Brevibacterium sp. TaxID=1701 RepID=UPI00264A29C1|nr:iron chelate uptake ABC transporter family permease subunit [Brevibacterium sp.]MDN5834533.1 iron chelate uptake ABC transporter family permease subunit [Brevibacterium sp.]MDN5909998.1 iron chelate uptake ABC transporter family permease subunit [Brevibacterium sp.]MDN6134554.1 iron chelate uptake ABC transporter family permease subunit [Brevibacterium sp.]MDN6158665.1 iron chelate uptake ABC transporter family permease subunit [Brevibacterium sp.]MDN6189864.1 iron chelate uptake ABC transp